MTLRRSPISAALSNVTPPPSPLSWTIHHPFLLPPSSSSSSDVSPARSTMITSSARLAATKAPLHTVATWTALTSNSLRTSPRALSACTHQRRHSSSKPSSPANGSKRVAQGVLPTEHGSTKTDSEKKSSRSSKADKDVATSKKAKDGVSLLPVSEVLKGRPAPSANTAQATSNKYHLPRVQNGGSSLQGRTFSVTI